MSNMQTTLLRQNGLFRLFKRKHETKKWYQIRCASYLVDYEIRCASYLVDHETSESIRDYFDPLRNKSGKFGNRWEFSNLEDAEQEYMLAILKWSDYVLQ